MFQRREIAQLEVRVARNVVNLANSCEQLRLLNCVYPEVRFHVQVQVEHVLGVAGLFDYQCQDAFLYRIAFHFWRRGRCWLRDRSFHRYLGKIADRRCCHWLFLEYRRRRHYARNLRRRRANILGSFGKSCGAPLISHAQRSLDHFQVRRGMAGYPLQPSIPGIRVGNARTVSQCARAGTSPILGLHPTQQRHANLRAKPGT